MAAKYPGCVMPYVTLTRETAKGIIWPALRDISLVTGIPLSFRQNDGTVTWPNGSKLVMRGCENEKEGEKLRGAKYPVVFIDEAQAFPSHLKPFIEDVCEPATMDYNGQIIVTGTPNAACAGIFHDICKNEGDMGGWSVHNWTMLDNEGLREKMEQTGTTPREWLDRKKAQKGWSDTHPTYMREYRGIWIRDTEGQVYAFDERRNLLDATFHEALDGVDDWVYTLGIDLGFKDPTAFVLLAFSESAGRTVVLETDQDTGLLSADIALKVRLFEDRWPISQIVVDTGGYGKGISEELKQKHGIACVPAEKVKKAAFIESLNSDLMSGQIHIVAGGNRALVDELILLQWDEDSMRTGKPKEDPRYANHLADALLYAWRASAHHMADWEENPLKHGSKEWLDQQEQEMWDKICAKIADEDKTPWYM